jgi:hypothetical protein
MPGREWAPAWVTWGHASGYFGWAPLAPNIRAEENWTPPAHAWTFVPQEHIMKPNVHDYVVNKTNNVTIVKNVTIINNVNTTVNNNRTVINNNNRTNNTTVNNTTVNNNNSRNTAIFNRGPRVNEVENVTNTKVQAVNINENNKPSKTVVSNNKLVIYRPVIKAEANPQQKAAPRKIETYKSGGNGNAPQRN